MDIIDKKPYPEDKTGMPNLTPVNPPVSPENEKETLKKSRKPAIDIKLLLLYGLLVIIGIVAAKYALDFFMPKKPAQGTAQAGKKNFMPPFITVVGDQKGGATQEKGLLSIKKKSPTAPSGPFTLTGIYFSGDKGYCIINNKILEEGQEVDGAKIVAISLEEVELQMQGKSIRLNLRK